LTALSDWPQQELAEELAHFQDLASLILPREENFPDLQNIDYHEAIEPYREAVCGDHLDHFHGRCIALQLPLAKPRRGDRF